MPTDDVGAGMLSEFSGAPGGPTVVGAVGDVGAFVAIRGFFVGGMGVCFSVCFSSLYFASASSRIRSGSTHIVGLNLPCSTFCLTLPM